MTPMIWRHKLAVARLMQHTVTLLQDFEGQKLAEHLHEGIIVGVSVSFTISPATSDAGLQAVHHVVISCAANWLRIWIREARFPQDI
jgi:signal transduction histidine kinase